MKNLNNKYYKYLFLLILLISVSTRNVFSQVNNSGFENNLTNWTATSGATTSTGFTLLGFTVNPAGSRMLRLEPTSNLLRNAAESNLGLTSNALLTFNNGLFSTSTNFGTITQVITLNAGQTVTMWWNYLSQDYSPFNDGVIATLVGPSYQQIQLLAVTDNAFGNTQAKRTGSYGSTNWFPVTFTAGVAGTYQLGFSTFNTGDQAVNPILLIDNAPGGNSSPGQAIVSTLPVSVINSTTITSGGNITSDGGSVVTARGVVYNTAGNPTLANSFTVNGSGSGSFTSTITGLVQGNTYYIRAYATNIAGTVYGGEVTHVTVLPPVATITANGPLTFCSPGSVVLTAGPASAYQWLLNGAPISGQTSNTLTATQSGNYSVTVQNSVGTSATSSTLLVTANPLPIATITANGSTTLCQGSSVSLTASTGASYLWSTGATTASINVTSAGSYAVTVTNAQGCSTTSAATVISNENTLPINGGQNVSEVLAANGFASVLRTTTVQTLFTEDWESNPQVLPSTILTNWNVLSGNVDVLASGTVYPAVTTGKWIDLDGSFSNGVIETKQSFNLKAGKQYLLIYDHSNNQTNNSFDNKLRVEFGAFKEEFTPPNDFLITNDRQAIWYSPKQDETVKIKFTSLGTLSSGGSVLDNIALLEVTGDFSINNASSAVCGVRSISVVETRFTCTNLGVNNTVMNVTGHNGLSASKTVTVIVEDKIAPTIVSKPISVTLTASGTVSITPQDVLLSGTDNCSGIITYTLSKSTFGATDAINSPVTVQLIGTDVSGNFTTVPVLVTVIDPVPVVITRNITVALDASGNATITPQQIDNGSSSVVGLSGLALDKTTFNCSNIGVNSVKLTVTSTLGSTAFATAIVTVIDDIKPFVIKPTFAAPSFLTTNVSEASKYNLAYTLNIPNAADWNLPSQIPYSVNNSLALQGKVIKRIAYALELDNKWVWTSMDAFSQNVNELGIPSGNVKFQQKVNNLNVFASSNSGITAGTGITTGNVEIFANCYGTNNISGVPGANNSNYDFGDGIEEARQNCYGSFQVHNYGTSQTLLSYNRWSGGGNSDLGIGNQIGNQPDWTFAQNAANFATKRLYILVETEDMSSAIAKDATVYLDAQGNVSISASTVDAGVKDNCAIATLTVSPSTFTGANIGVNTVTLTATDASGNITIATSIVTVLDSIKPIITSTQANVIVALDANNGTAGLIDYTSLATTTDNSGATVVITQSPAVGTPLVQNVPLTVTLTATDASGNFATQTFTVTATDQTAPVALAKHITVQLDATGDALITPQQVDNGSTDNVGIVSYALDKTSFDCTNVGTNTVTLTVTDASNFVSSATAVVTVIDSIKPIVLTQNRTIQLNAAGNATITAADINNGSTDNCSIATIVLDKTAFDCRNVGANTVTLTVTDVNGNVSFKTATVTVEDKIAPIVITQNATIQLNAEGLASISPSSINNGSTDNCSIASFVLSKTAFDCTNVGANTVTLTVTDVNGNVTTATAVVTVEDKIAPIVLTQNRTILLNSAGTATITAADINNGSTDNCSIASFVLSKTAFDCTTVGANTVTLTVTDVNGNVSTATAVVMVEDKIAPIVITQNATIQLNAEGLASISPSSINNGSTDNCSIASFVLSKTAFDCTNVGANTVTLTVTDVNGNVSTKTAVVTVEDKIAPIITPLAFQEICFVASNTYSLPTLTATDNCSVASVSYVLSGATSRIGSGNNASGTLNTGLTTIAWTVRDANGNVSTSSNDVRIWPLPVLTLTPSNADAFCNEVSLSPSSTIPVVAYRWMYNNTLFSTSAVLKLSIANADGNYQLFVTDIHGCVNTQIASYNFQKQGAISSYTILGLREVKLGENNKVLSGSVGAMGYKGKIDIKKNSSVAAAGAFVKAADIKVQSPSNVPTKIYAPVVTSLPTMQYFTGSTKNLAKVTASSNTTLTGNYKELTVKSGKTVTLTGSLFGKIDIEEGATVTFTSSVINIENLDVEGSSKAAYTNVLFSNDAIVKVSDKVDIERRSNINSTGKKVIFYVGSVKDHGKYYNSSHNDDDRCPSRSKDHRDDDDDDDDHDGEYGNGEFKVNGGESKVNASVYVPNGKIKVNGGEKLTTNMTGMFIAYKVESSEKNVNWNGFSCSALAAPMLMATNSVQATEAPKQVIETASLELLSTKFLAYPNPFARQTTISFTLPYQDDNATVDIYDLRGVKVQSIFKGAAAAQTAVEVQFNGQNIAAGTYFFRLTTGKETKNFKVVMID